MAIKTFRPHVSTTVEIDIIDSTSKFEAIVGQAAPVRCYSLFRGQRLR